jgi:predicted nuclease of predicted toxin-antitoxin system
MKFLIDAQLPRRLALALQAAGHDALHTLDLPEGNATTDTAINTLSAAQERIVVTKDGDFVNSFLLSGQPYKLLLISTGNIANAPLETLLINHLEMIVTAFTEYSFLELNATSLVVHQ